MIAPSVEPTDRSGLGPAFLAVRTRRGVVVLLVVLAAVCWWWTADQMSGMDNGPWSDLGTFGWFVSIWVVMMAAMMFPSVAPTVALYARMTGQRSPRRSLVFVAGYLLAWTLAGLAAYLVKVVVDAASGHVFAWDHAGRWVAGGALVMAAVYQFTPLKNVCLAKCRSPLGLLLGTWREGNSGALVMGAKNGAWCVGCCWALMVALFALGIMSLAWMALIAALIAMEKMLPWRRVALFGTAAVLAGLGVLVLVAPSALPGLTTPSKAPMQEMSPMG
jgi:predicted metal-binding membrane protein